LTTKGAKKEMFTRIAALAVLSACVLSGGSAVLSHSIASSAKRETLSSAKQEMLVSQAADYPGYRLVTTYNRGKTTFASLGIKNKLYIDDKFSVLEGYFVATAWAEYHVAINNSKVMQCMAKYSTKTMNSKRVSPQRSGVKYLPDTTATPFAIFINRVVEKPSPQGEITLGSAKVNSTGGNKLEFDLNPYPISGGDRTYETTYKQTAGVIGHELLHIFGFSHADVKGNNFTPIYGNDVYESGWCISRGGTDKKPGTFGLTDDGSVSDKFVD
jgi:hypothetical protein